MSSTYVKLYIGSVAALIWVAAVAAKHFWPDMDTGALVLACSNTLTALGVYHVAGAGDTPPPAGPTA